MRKTLMTGLVVGLLTVVMAVPALAANGKSEYSQGRPGSTLTVLVTGGDEDPANDVIYDSIVKADLPMKGRFQQLLPNPGGSTPVKTVYGPGDHGYVGGRWWMDLNDNDVMDEGDHFFICPLLGPGR